MKRQHMIFKQWSGWSTGEALYTYDELFPAGDPYCDPESLKSRYGSDISKECRQAAVGETIAWVEPFNGMVWNKRIK